jgi:ribonuclease-3
VEEIQRIIGYYFKNPALLINALTHKSYVNEKHSQGLKDNERLEFFGDAVLGLVISDYIFHMKPSSQEGELSKIRAAIVSESSLSTIAREIGIGPQVLLGKGEEKSGGGNKNSILANAFEALIAAIYIDGGYEKTYNVITSLLKDKIDIFKSDDMFQDYKSALQELIQTLKYPLPNYVHVGQEGPEHEKKFLVELVIDGTATGRGEGKNKKEAEQMAAKEVLTQLRSSLK